MMMINDYDSNNTCSIISTQFKEEHEYTLQIPRPSKRKLSSMQKCQNSYLSILILYSNSAIFIRKFTMLYNNN